MTGRIQRRFLMLLTSVLLALPAGVRAQGFQGLFTPDGQDVWAVGDSGTVYRSTNSGADYFSTTVGVGPLHGIAAQGLTAIMVGDGGHVWTSTNGGGAWTTQVLLGTPQLNALAFPAPGAAYVAGTSGRIFKSTDGGANWTYQISGVVATVWALKFTDAVTGWAVGDNGTVLHTVDGGSNWLPVAVPTTNRLRSVDASGATVWIGGDRGTCVRSLDGGAHWQPVNLKLDARSDVRVVRVQSATTIWLAGGGGFVRSTADGGNTWTFARHRMHGTISALEFSGARGYFASSNNRAVFHSADGGVTWVLPSGMGMTQTFVSKLSISNVRGSTIRMNPANEHAFFCAANKYVYRSRDDGETWAQIATLPDPDSVFTFNKCNAFVVSPKDSNVWLAAAAGNSPLLDRILRTTNAGASWDTVLTQDFGEYGIPLEMDPDHPDTVYFSPESSVLQRSTNFGLTWSPVMVGTPFRSPCDILCVPDSTNILYVADGVTGVGQGQYFRSTDGGVTFQLEATVTASGGSEIPGLACGRLRNNAVIGTNWSAGGVQRSLDYGATWPTVNSNDQAWGVDVARDDPNVIVFGQYARNNFYFTYDGGATWQPPVNVNAVGSNYGIFTRDRNLVLAQQGFGIWKLQTQYPYTPSSTQSINLSVPNGGETWAGGSVHNILWTHFNVPTVRIEYRRTADDPWQPVADVAGDAGSYAWTVPYDVTYDASVRVSDAWDASPSDESDQGFQISTPLAQAAPAELDYGSRVTGSASTLVVSLQNPGSAALVVSSVSIAGAGYTEGRTGFTIPPGALDTIGVTFRPTTLLKYPAMLSIASNAHGSPTISVPLMGTGVGSTFSALPTPLELGTIDPGATAYGNVRVSNYGGGPLAISNVSSSNPEFVAGRTSFTVPAGGSDTVRVYYHPIAAGADTTVITFTAADTAAPHSVVAHGTARGNVAVSPAPPVAFALDQNHPNPFGRSTEIRYALPRAARVTLEVFDVRGHRLARLVDGAQEAGRYAVSFGSGAATSDGARLGAVTSGVYFYRLTAGRFTSTRKMLFIR